MDPLAAYSAAPVAAPAIPTEWITSGVVTPVMGSPAAATATTWAPQPAAYASTPASESGSMMGAIASAMFGAMPTSSGDAAAAQQQIAAQAQQQAQLQAQQQSYVQSSASAMPQPVSMVAMGAPAAAAAVAPVQMLPAAAPADPTLIGSTAAALSGFASATGRAVGNLASVAGAGVSKGRRVGGELWAGVRSPRAIHVTQVPSKYNSAPAAGNRDCGPASVVMTLKLLGRKIPGAAANASPQRLINRVRQLAGAGSNAAATTNHELGRALRAAGTRTREIADARSIRDAVASGKPVILNGNPRNQGAYGRSFSPSQMSPYDGGHWIVVSGIDERSGKFIINDPLSKIGPVKVTPTQLEAYRGGSLGIEVDA